MGQKATSEAVVLPSMTEKAIRSGSPDVLSTSAVAALMEEAACAAVADALGEGMTTVGTELSVRRLAPTPAGAKIRAEALTLMMDERRALFQVEVYDETGLIAKGTHTRVFADARRLKAEADGRAGK